MKVIPIEKSKETNGIMITHPKNVDSVVEAVEDFLMIQDFTEGSVVHVIFTNVELGDKNQK